MKQEQQPTYSQRVIEDGGVLFRIYACVNAQAKAPPMIVAETLQQLDIPVKITDVGKNIDGVDQPDYLGAFSEIWVSEQGMEFVERLKALERYQKSLVTRDVDWIIPKLKRMVARSKVQPKVHALPV